MRISPEERAEIDAMKEFMLHVMHEPDALPEFPLFLVEGPLAQALIAKRTQDEYHKCVRCEAVGEVALIVSHFGDNRWLDLCRAHHITVMTATSELMWENEMKARGGLN